MKSKRNLFMISGVQLQKCQRQFDADSDPLAATGKRGQWRGWEADWKSFHHSATQALERGNDGGGKLLGSPGHQSPGKQA